MAIHLAKPNALFLHIPKTGGCWVKRALAVVTETREWTRQEVDAVALSDDPDYAPGTIAMGHCNLHYCPGNFAAVFAFVRHPVTWYESWFACHQRYGQAAAGPWPELRPVPERWGDSDWPTNRLPTGMASFHAVLDDCQVASFPGFVRRCLEYRPGFVSRMYEHYLGGHNGEGPPRSDSVRCDGDNLYFTGRQESLAGDLAATLTLLGLDGDKVRDVPPVNVSARPPEIKWDAGVLREIIAAEKPAIDRFYNGAEAA